MANLTPEGFAKEIVSVLKLNGQWNRAISLDIETKILDNEYLTNERVLAAGVAYRSGDKIMRGTVMLEDETDEHEFLLLKKLGSFFRTAQPLALLGYNISGYDIPLLNMKMKHWGDFLGRQTNPDQPEVKQAYPSQYWALKDALTRTYVLDIMHPARFEIAGYDSTPPKYLSLEKVIGHPLFSSLPLMGKKHLAGEIKEEKGKKIYEMWKSRDPNLEEYLKADVHDTLLIAEKIFQVREIGEPQ